MLQPYGYYDGEACYAGDPCPECGVGTMVWCYDWELVCPNCGFTLEPRVSGSPGSDWWGWGIAENGRLVDLGQYEAVNVFSGQPEGTVGTPPMNLRSTGGGRVSGAVWLEQRSKTL